MSHIRNYFESCRYTGRFAVREGACFCEKEKGVRNPPPAPVPSLLRTCSPLFPSRKVRGSALPAAAFPTACTARGAMPHWGPMRILRARCGYCLPRPISGCCAMRSPNMFPAIPRALYPSASANTAGCPPATAGSSSSPVGSMSGGACLYKSHPHAPVFTFFPFHIIHLFTLPSERSLPCRLKPFPKVTGSPPAPPPA